MNCVWIHLLNFVQRTGRISLICSSSNSKSSRQDQSSFIQPIILEVASSRSGSLRLLLYGYESGNFAVRFTDIKVPVSFIPSNVFRFIPISFLVTIVIVLTHRLSVSASTINIPSRYFHPWSNGILKTF